ncbi:COP9 signalosome complex subunit 1 [Yarrowia sp. C11]|nr:COP9 signalosome complex subunit 1 [Yarrowia sp. E02]KAG5367790.1 COP9 signalosome complex subunit 1 [Yarrowia sp. C11]
MKELPPSVSARLQSYPPGAQIQRLVEIGDSHKQLRQQCLEKALAICRQATRQVDAYERILKRLDKLLKGAAPAEDKAWIEQTRSENAAQIEELKSHKSQAKFDDLITTYLCLGRYQDARKACAARRDNNNDWEHSLHLRVMEARSQFLDGEKVTTIHKVLDSRDELKPVDLNLALLLAALHELQATTTMSSHSGSPSTVTIAPSAFAKAAEYFLDMDFEYLTHYADVALPGDVGRYIAVCALVSFSRAQLSALVNQNFGFSELVGADSDIMKMLQSFVDSEFLQFFKLWNVLISELPFDLVFGDIVGTVDSLLRERALIQAIFPYTQFRLDELAQSFDMEIDELETLLRQMIVALDLKLRIDKIDGTVTAYQSDGYSQLKQNKKLAKAYIRSAKMAMLALDK